MGFNSGFKGLKTVVEIKVQEKAGRTEETARELW